VAAEDIRWLLTLTAQRVHQASGHQYRSLGIDASLAGRAADVFRRELEGGRALTRDELGKALVAADVVGPDAAGLKIGYLIGYAELEAILINGPRRGRRQTYALFDERVPPSPRLDRDAALAELARRYVRGHGPAQDVDLAWWSGLTLREARRALEAAGTALRSEQHDGRTFWADAAEAGAKGGGARRERPTVHLLPNYDELLIAFRDRSDAMDPGLPPPARVAAEILAHVIVRGGLGIGGWKRRDGPKSTLVELNPLVPLRAADRVALQGAVDRFATYLGKPVEASGLD
jgi:hypothetical protein